MSGKIISISGKDDFLLEIGTEEIPAGFIEPALRQLEQKAGQLCAEHRLRFKKLNVMATPRRFVLYIKDLWAKQEQTYQIKWGPPKSAAFDEQGNPTQVYEGFRKSQRAKDGQIKVKSRKGKGEYLCLVEEKPARLTGQLLPEILPSLITSIQFPKTMKWDGALSFVRPIRWLLAVYGKKPVRFRLGNLTSDAVTYGHRIFSSGPYRIKDVDDYFSVIKKTGIILDQQKRKENIRKQLCRQAKRLKASQEFNETLLNEVNNLVESPVVICGGFKQEYLKLPPEVLITSMAKNQKLFCFSSKNRLLPKFAAVINGRVKNISIVRKNYESVLEAKLKDSRFFYHEDTRTPLEEKVAALEKVVFQEQLGSLFDKTQRMMKLADALAGQLGLTDKDSQALRRAVYLSKADLVSQMVAEFPGLQGIMGREYALASGEAKEVCQAIAEHYLPRSAGDRLPATLAGALASIVDKIDNITGCFFLGQEPSGSYDPYALKRQAAGIIRIIIDHKLHFSLSGIIENALNFYSSCQPGGNNQPAKIKNQTQNLKKNKPDKIKIKGKILGLFRDRLSSLLIESKYRYDLIDAVLASGYDDLADTWTRLKQLNSILAEDKFEQARNVVERTNNILKGADVDPQGDVEENMFVDELETQLWDVYKAERGQIEQLIASAKYKEAAFAYGKGFYKIIHRFFDKVMVNVDDEKLRSNRLRMMKHINRLYTSKVADLARIVVTRNQPVAGQRLSPAL